MDRQILAKWLKAGYVYQGMLHPTEAGTPQGGIISPALLTVTLSGLESTIKQAVKSKDKVNVIAYADDFIVTGASQEILETKVMPILKAFLAQRGLQLSPEKTKITAMGEGFNFLGVTLRKYASGKVLTKPSKPSVKRLLTKVRTVLKCNKAVKTISMIRMLNPILRGWANYYRFTAASRTFNYIDCCTFRAIMAWIRRRHPNKSAKWRKSRYFRQQAKWSWTFTARTFNPKSHQAEYLDLFRVARVSIKRHVKIKGDANPYDPTYTQYFKVRDCARIGKSTVMTAQQAP